MDEQEVKAICEAARLPFSPAMMESLAVIEGMMEAVAASALCVDGDTTPTATADAPLRPDTVAQNFTRDEMLAGAKGRQGDFVLVPRVIGG